MAKTKKGKPGRVDGLVLVAANKKARHRYEILERYEAGIELLGSEVKSLRGGHVSISESFCRVKKGQVYVHGLTVDRYAQSGYILLDPLRTRRLLLHRQEIKKISAALERKGLALVPLRLYFNDNGLAKLEIALGRGKSAPDKRESLKQEDVRREVAREMRKRT